MLSQSQIGRYWGPACSGLRATVSLHGRGKVTIRAAIIEAVKAFNQCLVVWNYQTRYADTGAFACRQKVGGRGWSSHSYATAIDINWQLNPYGGSRHHIPTSLATAICRIRTNNGKQVWNWGGFWRGTKDWMHFEIVCTPRDIATGINWNTVPGSTPANVPKPPVRQPAQPVINDEGEDMYYRVRDSGAIFHVSGMFYRHLDGPTWAAEQFLNGAKIHKEITGAEFMKYVDTRKLKDANKVTLK